MLLKVFSEVLVVFGKLLQVRNVHLDELDVPDSDETDVTLETFDDRVDEQLVFEDPHAHLCAVNRSPILLDNLALDVALVQNEIQQVDDVDLHRMVLSLDGPIQRLDEWLYYDMSHLVGNRGLLTDLFEQQIHKLTG